MGRQLSPVSEALKTADSLFLAAFREAAVRLKATWEAPQEPSAAKEKGELNALLQH